MQLRFRLQQMTFMRRELLEAMQKVITTASEAYAFVYGGKKYPHIKGFVYFFPLWGGTVVLADVAGLPTSEAACREKIFAFHIHEGSSCEENAEGDFPLTGSHLNPKDCPHPEHAGDLPPLFENDGYALSMFYTNRFVPEEIIGRTVVIHENPDDFKTQPSGDSGSKIACGEIKSNLED